MSSDLAQNCTAFRWTRQRASAAMLLARDEQSDEQIAASLGIARRTLDYWKGAPEFAERVRANVVKMEERVLSIGIAQRAKRVEAKHERWELMRQVIRERAEDPSVADVPGGKTGLVIRQLKSIGMGRNNQTVEEFVVDTGLLSELRAHEKEAAQELGQWTEKRELSGDPKRPIYVERAVDIDAIQRAEQAYIEALGGQSSDLGLREGDAGSSDQG